MNKNIFILALLGLAAFLAFKPESPDPSPNTGGDGEKGGGHGLEAIRNDAGGGGGSRVGREQSGLRGESDSKQLSDVENPEP